jgi:hypothetical protein
MMRDLLADGSEKQSSEPAKPAWADDEKVGAPCRGNERRGGITLDGDRHDVGRGIGNSCLDRALDEIARILSESLDLVLGDRETAVQRAPASRDRWARVVSRARPVSIPMRTRAIDSMLKL